MCRVGLPVWPVRSFLFAFAACVGSRTLAMAFLGDGLSCFGRVGFRFGLAGLFFFVRGGVPFAVPVGGGIYALHEWLRCLFGRGPPIKTNDIYIYMFRYVHIMYIVY